MLRNDGSAFALVHNHPSGDPTPSPADLRATERVAGAARIVDLRLVDHLVTTDHAWASVCTLRRGRARHQAPLR